MRGGLFFFKDMCYFQPRYMLEADLDKLQQIHQWLCTDFIPGDSGRPVTPPLTPEKWKTEKGLCCFKCAALRWGHFLPYDKAYLGRRLLSLPRAVGHLQISMVSAAVHSYSKFYLSCVFLIHTKYFFRFFIQDTKYLKRHLFLSISVFGSDLNLLWISPVHL